MIPREKAKEYWVACAKGNLQKVKEISTEYNDVINWKNLHHSRHYTGLHIACEMRQTEIVDYIIKLPHIQLNQRDYRGRTSLYVACLNGNEDIVEILLTYGRGIIDVNQGDNNEGRTPLHAACLKGKEEIVKILLASGEGIDVRKKTNPGDKDWNGKTAAEIARMRNSNDIADLIDEYARNPRDVMLKMKQELGISLLSSPFFFPFFFRLIFSHIISCPFSF